jgi:hypothetical protein
MRDYICFELDDANYDIALKRADVAVQGTIFNTREAADDLPQE